ncbi:MAG TPA: SURF1 family protein [Methylophilaceae bacterium]|nr:SURF1 family protein [Methylophilaceae bacterium]
MTPRGAAEGRAGQQPADSPAPDVGPRQRSNVKLLMLALAAALVFTGFVALGTWQIKRLHWKLDLIARVDQRVHAPPVAAPGPDQWPQLNAEADEYRHVRVTGTFLYDLTTRVQALTRLGGGYWLLTPLRRPDGSIVMINRGFIPADSRTHQNASGKAPETVDSSTDEVTTVTGLLRISEPGGAFLHHNDPAANRWYSRDVQAIAAARGLLQVAPYFVDADAGKPGNKKLKHDSVADPIGGLTVVSFPNNHLVYAITWYALALMVAGACIWIAREERKLRRDSDSGA